jgi:hypothetical protein
VTAIPFFPALCEPRLVDDCQPPRPGTSVAVMYALVCRALDSISSVGHTVCMYPGQILALNCGVPTEACPLPNL